MLDSRLALTDWRRVVQWLEQLLVGETAATSHDLSVADLVVSLDLLVEMHFRLATLVDSVEVHLFGRSHWR